MNGLKENAMRINITADSLSVETLNSNSIDVYLEGVDISEIVSACGEEALLDEIGCTTARTYFYDDEDER